MLWNSAPRVLALCAACAGCGVAFDSTPLPELGSGGAGGVGGSSVDTTTGAGGSGVGGYGGESAGLTSKGLLARYHIDEATSGQLPAKLNDSADAPLALPITYGAEMGFFEDGNAGLRWTVTGADGRASAPVDGSKVTALEGSSTGTIEVVLSLSAVTSNWSRISHIGSSDEVGRFTLLSGEANTLMAWWNTNDQLGAWNIGLTGLGRVVVHVVLDTNQVTPADRARLYLDGVVQADISGATPPALGAGIELATGRHYVLGNREVGGRTFMGTLYYAALYTSALDASTVQHHAEILSAADDGP
jgi:hypothetical protein